MIFVFILFILFCSSIFINQIPERCKTFKKMVFECCVKGCGTVARNGLHSFPSNKLIAEKWIMAIKGPKLMDRLRANTLSFHKICKKHFIDTDFHLNGKEQLVVKPNSIPSLFLPDDDDHQTARMPLKPVKRLQKQHSKSYRNATKQSGKKRASDNGNDNVYGEVCLDLANDIEMTTLNNDSDVDVVGLDSDMEICSYEGIDLNSSKGRKVNKITNGPKFSYYKKRVKELGQKVKQNKINDNVVLNYLSKKFNKTLFIFFQMQLRNCGRSKRGRRYMPDEKSLCLAMYKHGPKSYRFKDKWSALPTNRTLGRYSANLMFKSGVDRNMLEAVKNVVKDWPESDKYCSIVWDEVSLKEHLDHNQSQDYIEGFVEMNETKKPIFATHALTFMVRGLNRSYKQAMGNFYTNGIKSFELVELVKLMIAESLKTGLKPILSMCDQCNINASTVNALANPANPSTKQLGGLLQYKVNGHQLIHGYDPSHLIKVTRNNLQKKNLAHFISKRWQSGDKEKIGSLQIAAWDDLHELYRMDSRSTQRRLPKLTDEHLKPLKLKMKVSLATQVFSNTCGSVMLRYVQQGILPEHFTSTAQLLLFMNDLFDSINGSGNGNTLKSAVTENSIHFEFWDYALSMLQNMFFVDKYTGDRNDKSSVLKKFESTIRAYKEIAKICFDLNIPSVNIRDTTQDGLENFFGCVKSCNQNNKATPAQYRTGYNTMTIINITGTNSLHTNCLPDQSSPILTNFHDFISKCKRETINVSNSQSLFDVDDIILFDPISEEEDEAEAIINYKDLNTMIAFDPQSDLSDEENYLIEREDTIAFDAQCLQAKVDFVEYEAISNECALICQKLIKFTSCEKCKNNIKSIAETALISCVEKVICSLNKIIPHICFENSIKKKLLSHIESIKIDFIGCSEHNQEISQKIKSLSADRIILTFCNGINKILSGKTNTLPVNHNYMEKLAYDHRMKKKRIGKYSDIFNNQ